MPRSYTVSSVDITLRSPAKHSCTGESSTKRPVFVGSRSDAEPWTFCSPAAERRSRTRVDGVAKFIDNIIAVTDLIVPHCGPWAVWSLVLCNLHRRLYIRRIQTRDNVQSSVTPDPIERGRRTRISRRDTAKTTVDNRQAGSLGRFSVLYNNARVRTRSF